ncbi:putative signal transducing protein [Aridibaculum aurantiacum]|uniref:putative signal transducing protein n=1 Tax=Aridibaculum aurantiacum TaxID=2810307 RepID=UPI001A97429A|nr:DUF2007 domain-containing protein [Aridibaculum aurantiacum]
MHKWSLLYSARTLPEATIVQGMLEENNVPVMVMNKQDSSYLNFGYIEVYVPFHLMDVAKQLMDKGLAN